MMIIGFNSNGDYGFSMALMGFQWHLWVFNGNYGFLLAVFGFF